MGIFWDNKNYRTETCDCRILTTGWGSHRFQTCFYFTLQFDSCFDFLSNGVSSVTEAETKQLLSNFGASLPSSPKTHMTPALIQSTERKKRNRNALLSLLFLLTLRSNTHSLCIPQNRELHFKTTVQLTQSRIKLTKRKVLVEYTKTKQHLQPASISNIHSTYFLYFLLTVS